MARIFVAYRTSEDPEGVKPKHMPPERMADGSQTTLKKRLREWKNTEWKVAFYNIKTNIKTLVQLFEDVSEVEAESAEDYRVNDSGQVRKVT